MQRRWLLITRYVSAIDCVLSTLATVTLHFVCKMVQIETPTQYIAGQIFDVAARH